MHTGRRTIICSCRQTYTRAFVHAHKDTLLCCSTSEYVLVLNTDKSDLEINTWEEHVKTIDDTTFMILHDFCADTFKISSLRAFIYFYIHTYIHT